jgi:hypothetical protein
MKPYYQHAGITIYHGDARDVVRDDFEVIVCDPPYGLNLGTVIGDEGLELRNWLVSFRRPMLIFGSPKVEKPAGVRATLVWDKSELTGQGDLSFPWKATHEEIYVLGEGFESRRRRGSVLRYPLRPSWSNHPDSVSGIHPTEKPVPLMVDLLECCPWMEVLDPFCGTGPTLWAAKKLGKLATGIEIHEPYCEIAAKRLSQEVLDFSGEIK